MYKLNEQMKFTTNGILQEVLVKGITPDGLLIVETANKKEEKWLWGTVEWMV